MKYYVTVDSFGSDIPDNWEEIATKLNKTIDDLDIADDIDAVNELWDKYWSSHSANKEE